LIARRTPPKNILFPVLAMLVVSILVVVPTAEAFTYGDQYGVYSLTAVNYSGSCCTYDQKPPAGAGDGLTGPITASGSGTDTYGDSAGASVTTDVVTHTISGEASADCVTTSVCDQPSYGGIGASGEGDMYDRYSASCSGTCPAYIDLYLIETVTGSFASLDPGPAPGAGSYSYIFGEVLLPHGLGLGSPITLCNGSNGCMRPVYNYLQGGYTCQGGGDPQDYCPYSSASQLGTTFVYSVTAYLTPILISTCGELPYNCDINPSNPITLEFVNSIFADRGNPGMEGLTLTSSTFQVCTSDEGVTITSAASGILPPCSGTATTTSTTASTSTATSTTTSTSITTPAIPTNEFPIPSSGLVVVAIGLLALLAIRRIRTPGKLDSG